MNNKILLIILRVRQSGKTYIIDKFCRKEFEHYIYINLFEQNNIIELYNSNLTSYEKFKPKYSIRINTKEFG